MRSFINWGHSKCLSEQRVLGLIENGRAIVFFFLRTFSYYLSSYTLGKMWCKILFNYRSGAKMRMLPQYFYFETPLLSTYIHQHNSIH